MRTARWLDEVLTEAGRLGMPAPSCDEWLAFTRGRRAARVERVSWDAAARELHFTVACPQAVDGLTVLTPPCASAAASDVSVGELRQVAGQDAFVLDVAAGTEVPVTVGYAR